MVQQFGEFLYLSFQEHIFNTTGAECHYAPLGLILSENLFFPFFLFRKCRRSISNLNELENAFTVTKLIKWKFFSYSFDDSSKDGLHFAHETDKRYIVDDSPAAHPKSLGLLNVKRNLYSLLLWKMKKKKKRRNVYPGVI